MYILSMLLSVAVSADALLIGTAYGLKKVKIPFASQLIIGLCACLCSFASVIVSKGIFAFLSALASKIISISALFLLGFYFLLKAVFTNIKPGEKLSLLSFAIKSMGLKISVVRDMSMCDIDNSGIIDNKEAFLLGLTLSGDIAAVGLFASPTGMESMLFAVFTGIFNVLCICIGNKLGHRANHIKINLKKIADFALPVVIFISLATKLFF